MKKVFLLLCFVMSILNFYAQEVRGVETRRAIYQGEEYKLYYEDANRNDHEFGKSSEYYGFEFTNRNSIPVSVSIEIYKKSWDNNPDKMVHTKDIVLQSQESYICKYPVLCRYKGCYIYYDEEWKKERFSCITSKSTNMWRSAEGNGTSDANRYYVKYKAYKLL